jgi:hypothetical protein
MKAIGKALGTILLTYSAHYCITKIYNYVCVPDGIQGFLYGIISTGSPICQMGIQAITSTQTSYSSMILMGVSRGLIDFIAPDYTSQKTI